MEINKSFKHKLSFVMPVAVLVAACLLTAACKGGADMGGEVTITPPVVHVPSVNIDPATQLKKLQLRYSDDNNAASNLITFSSADGGEEQVGEYALVDEEGISKTDSAKSALKVNAQAKSSDAHIMIWWTNESDVAKGGGMEEARTDNESLNNIPIPNTQDNTYIYINVINGAGMFEYIITVPPPLVDTTLRELSVKIDSVDVSIAFDPKVTQYDITTVTAQEDKSILVEAAACDDDAIVTINPEDAKVPLAGAAHSTVVEVKVTKDSVTSTYSINVYPPQNGEGNDTALQALQFEYIYEAGSNTTVISGDDFSADKTSYTFHAAENALSVKLSLIQTRSSISSAEISVGGSAYNISTKVPVTLPLKASGNTLTFIIVVTASNGDTRPYTINFDNPQKFKNWGGTATVSGVPAGTTAVVDHVEVVYEGGVTSSSTMTDSNWAVTLDDRLTPTAFVVAILRTKGGTTTTVKELFAPPAGKQSDIALSVVFANTARMIYNATDFLAIGEAGNNTENWYLANDIVLPDSTNGWAGPQGYSGHFYGNGHSITNLKIKATKGNIGLFSSLDGGAVVENFTLDIESAAGLQPDSDTVNNFYFGGVIGQVNTNKTTSITIDKVRVTGSIDIGAIKSGSGANVIVGGLVGLLSSNNKSPLLISNCISEVNIEAALGSVSNGQTGQQAFGGLIGKTAGSAGANITIKNSGATGTIDVSNKSTSYFFAGGLVGYGDENNNSAVIKIENCYTKSTINQARSGVTGNSSSTTISVIGAGGIAGKFAGASGSYIKNSCVLGPYLGVTDSVTDKSNANRIVGVFITAGSTLSGNRANSAMVLLPVLSSRGNAHDTWNGLGTGLSQTADIITTLNTNAPNTWRWDNDKGMPVLVQ
ncbi:MAG: hypothetical protein Ta2F_08290 [Termitinemataceae bacterium]|nr:MAG: hypothetical protein Ta2F_08290 [Termitinemataceae bacterium]